MIVCIYGLERLIAFRKWDCGIQAGAWAVRDRGNLLESPGLSLFSENRSVADSAGHLWRGSGSDFSLWCWSGSCSLSKLFEHRNLQGSIVRLHCSKVGRRGSISSLRSCFWILTLMQIQIQIRLYISKLPSFYSDADPDPASQKDASGSATLENWFSREGLLLCYDFCRAEKKKTRVSYPHWFYADPDTDPDPTFFLIADPDPGFDYQKLKKKNFIAGNLISIFLIKNCNLLIPRPP